MRKTSRVLFLNLEDECTMNTKEHCEIVTVTVWVRHTIGRKEAISEIIASWFWLFLNVQQHLPIAGCKTLLCNWIFLRDPNKNYTSLFSLRASGFGNKQCLKGFFWISKYDQRVSGVYWPVKKQPWHCIGVNLPKSKNTSRLHFSLYYFIWEKMLQN